MTDPIFRTWKCVDAWADANWQYAIHLPFDTIRNLEVFDAISGQIARVRAAHSYLKGNDDAKH